MPSPLHPFRLRGRLALLLLIVISPVAQASTSGHSHPNPLRGGVGTTPPQRIRLVSRAWDPITAPDTRDTLALQRPELLDDPYHYLVQFEGKTTAQARQALQDRGARLYDSLPDGAVLVRCLPDEASRLADLPGVRWVGPFLPMDRIEPGLERWLGDAVQGNNPIRLRLIASPDIEPAGFGKILERRSGGAIIESTRTPRNYYFTLEIPRQRLVTVKQGDLLLQLAGTPGVFWVEHERKLRLFNNRTAWVIQSGENPRVPIWDLGIYGEGQVIGVADTGLDADHCMFWDPKYGLPTSKANYQHRKVVAYIDRANSRDWDGQGHGTHVAGIACGDDFAVPGLPNNKDGMAPRAKLVMQDIGRGNQAYVSPGDLYNLFDESYKLGARIHNDSWGVDENIYSSLARQVDEFVRDFPDMLVCYANGNSGPGPGTVGEPATAKNIVSVGATENGAASSAVFSFSSRGPASDGRIKPTIVVPGVANSAKSDRNVTSFNCDYVDNYGTSMASPAASGAAALVREYFEKGFYPSGKANPADGFSASAALVHAIFVLSGKILPPLAYPGPEEGWGRILLEDALAYEGKLRSLFVDDHREKIEQDENITYSVLITSRAEVFRASLVWTDYPAATFAQQALVSNLDLQVIDTVGNIYFGNVFEGADSMPGGDPDAINVEEVVQLFNPPPGTYTIRVHATSLPQGPQDFALAVGAALGFSKGAFTISKPVAACRDKVRLRITDADLARNRTVPVTVTSPAYPQGRTFTLPERPFSSGIFWADFNVATTQVGTNYYFLVQPDTQSVFTYTDLDAGDGNVSVPNIRALKVDCTGPFLSDLYAGVASPTLGKVSFTTHEPSTVTVRYGTAMPFPEEALVDEAATAHTVYLPGLNPCTEYGFEIEVRDIFDNAALYQGSAPEYAFSTPQAQMEDIFDFEVGPGAWMVDGNWTLDAGAGYGGGKGWHTGGLAGGSQILRTPPLALDATLPSEVSFWTKYDFEKGFDGGFLMVTTDGGSSWGRLEPIGGYGAVMDATSTSCAGAGRAAFSGAGTDWHPVTVSLAAFKGLTVEIAFHYCTDPTIENDGWYVDDFSLQTVQPCGAAIDVAGISFEETANSCGVDNGVLDPGEEGSIVFDLENLGILSTGPLTATFSTGNPSVTLPETTAQWGDLFGKRQESIVVEASTGASCGVFDVTISLTDGTVETTKTFWLPINQRTQPQDIWWYNGQTAEDWQAEGEWSLDPSRAMVGDQAWWSGNGETACSRLVSPVIHLEQGTNPELTFWTLYFLEPHYDAGEVQISEDGGLTWGRLEPAGNYPGVMNPDTTACVGRDVRAFTGNQTFWRYFAFDLSAYAGKDVRLGFVYSSDRATGNGGWYLDAFNLTGGRPYELSCRVSACGQEDTTPPTAPTVTPSQLFTNNTTLTVLVQASDPESGVQSYLAAVSQNASGHEAYGWAELDANRTITLKNTQTKSNTTYYVHVRARNGEGDLGPVGSSAGIFMDFTRPKSGITNLAEGQIIEVANYRVEGTAEELENGSGLVKVEITFDNGGTWLPVQGLETWTYDWNITSYGAYEIRSRATDRAGNVESNRNILHVTAGLKHTPWIPLAGYWNTHLTTQGGALTILAAALDAVDQVESVEVLFQGTSTGVFLKDDGSQGDWVPGDSLFMLSVPDIGPGAPRTKLLLQLQATDAAGFQSLVWPYLEVE